MSESKNASPVTLIGLPYHCGTRGRVIGNAMAIGPEVLLAQDNAPKAFEEVFGDVEVVFLDQADRATDKETGGDFRLLPAGDQMGRILVQNIHLANAVREARAAGRIPIVAAGTCSSSLGVVGGVGDAQGNIGLIWFDAHGDAELAGAAAHEETFPRQLRQNLVHGHARHAVAVGEVGLEGQAVSRRPALRDDVAAELAQELFVQRAVRRRFRRCHLLFPLRADTNEDAGAGFVLDGYRQ